MIPIMINGQEEKLRPIYYAFFPLHPMDVFFVYLSRVLGCSALLYSNSVGCSGRDGIVHVFLYASSNYCQGKSREGCVIKLLSSKLSS
jgi:hypothetical protein